MDPCDAGNRLGGASSGRPWSPHTVRGDTGLDAMRKTSLYLLMLLLLCCCLLSCLS